VNTSFIVTVALLRGTRLIQVFNQKRRSIASALRGLADTGMIIATQKREGVLKVVSYA